MWNLAVFVVDCDGVMVCIVVESGVSSVFLEVMMWIAVEFGVL